MVSLLPSAYQQRIHPDWVRPIRSPPFQLSKPKGKRARLGIKYEHVIKAQLEEEFGLYFMPGFWFAYGTGGRTRYCQLDGLLLLEPEKRAVIVEVKHSHTADAYWQVENLYYPIVRKSLEGTRWDICTVEVVKWFDPAVRFPTRPRLRETLRAVRPGEFAVCIKN